MKWKCEHELVGSDVAGIVKCIFCDYTEDLREKEIELVDAIPELEEEYRKVVSNAIKEKIITLEEWNNRFKNYKDDCGYSFIHYLVGIMNNLDAFITSNPIMLDNKEELEKRFGVKVSTVEELLKSEKEKNGNL